MAPPKQAQAAKRLKDRRVIRVMGCSRVAEDGGYCDTGSPRLQAQYRNDRSVPVEPVERSVQKMPQRRQETVNRIG
jgi:hypothetical protein